MIDPDIAVLIVDDQALVRSGLRRILRRRSGFVIVGECSDGAEAPEAAARLKPDVVLMDLRMKGMNGIETTRLLVAEGGPPVLILTTFDDDELLSGALRAGACGFLLKDSPPEDLIRAVRAVASGDSFLDPSVTARVLASYRNSLTYPEPKAQEELTRRELDVLVLIGRGSTNGEISRKLFISEATVKSHIGRIFVKLGLRDRAAAIVYAYDCGIVEPRRT